MAGLIEYTGMNERPMFINYTPYSLDLSPYRQNQQMKLEMMQQLVKQRQASKQKISDMEMPELPGIHTSVMQVENLAAAAKAKMLEAASGGNLNHPLVQQEILKAGREYNRYTSSGMKRALEEEKADIDFYQKQFEKDGYSGLLFMDELGRPAENPDDPTQPLFAGVAVKNKMGRMDQGILGDGQKLDFRAGLFAHPKEVQEELQKIFSASGSTLTSPSAKNDFATLSQLASNADASPSDRIAAALTINSRYKSNKSQIDAGVKAWWESAGPRERGAIRNAFVHTPEFVIGTTPTSRGGKGTLLKDGKIDWSKVDEAMHQQNQTPALSGYGKRASFAENFVLGPAARALNLESTMDPQLKQAGGGAGKAANMGKLNEFGFHAYKGPTVVTDAVTNEPRPAFEPQPIDVPVNVDKEKGTADFTSVPQYKDELSPSVHAALLRTLGLTTSSNQPAEGPPRTLGELFRGRTATLPRGNEINTNDHNGMQVLEVSREIVYEPADKSKGAKGVFFDGTKVNGVEPYLQVKVRNSEETPLMDYIKVTDEREDGRPGRTYYKQVEVSDSDYRRENPDMAGPGTGEGDYGEVGGFFSNLIQPWEMFGNQATDIWIKIPFDALKTDPEENFLVDPDEFGRLRSPAAEYNAASQKDPAINGILERNFSFGQP
jgi:hypothetical protein